MTPRMQDPHSVNADSDPVVKFFSGSWFRSQNNALQCKIVYDYFYNFKQYPEVLDCYSYKKRENVWKELFESRLRLPFFKRAKWC